MHRILIFTIMLCFVGFHAQADQNVPYYIETSVPNATAIGQGRMTYMFLDIYDAVLYAPNGTVDTHGPLALTLTYLRHLNGQKIADKSASEMRRLGFDDPARLADWQNKMREIFPNVEKGTRITGIMNANDETVFYLDTKEIGRITDPEFGPLFFGIWLDPKTTDPELRQALLEGQKK